MSSGRQIAIFHSIFVVIITVISNVIGNEVLVENTHDVFGDNGDGLLVAAFGDYNSDKLVDIFVIADRGKTLQILMAYDVEPILRPSTFRCAIEDGTVTSVVPGDYDGDSQMDILITVQLNSELNNQEFRIIWGSPNILNCSSAEVLTGAIRGQPLVFDYNGDRIPDLFGEDKDMRRTVWIMSSHRNYSVQVMPNGTGTPLRVPHSHAFIDLNSDMAADLLVTTKNGYEFWYNVQGSFQYKPEMSVKLPAEVILVGQSVITDLDMDGKLDHLVPVCFDSTCSNSTILIYKKSWNAIDVNFQNGNVQWGFVPPLGIDSIAEDTISLRVGDFNLDGYPDLLAVLRSKSNPNERMATVLLNVESSSGSFQRAFSVLWNVPGLKDIKDVQLAAFYDAYNDGIVDILVVRRTLQGNWKLVSFKNVYDTMACFIKVIVSSGLCYKNCPNDRIPYGVNQPGSAVCYKSTTPEGDPQASCSGLLSQSAHFALQLPYVIFGLGHTPNFVDSLTVGIPYPKGHEIRSHEWTGIIPNSQMFVVPYLEDENGRWMNKLFVTPSHLVLITFAALMGVMGFIFFIILGLHWKERMEDKKEKLQEAHRFHFDAM